VQEVFEDSQDIMSIAEGYQDAHGLSDNDFEEGGEEDGGKQKRKRQQSFPRYKSI